MTSPVTVGVSLKMYLGHRQTLEWCAAVAELTSARESLRDGTVQLFVIPGFLSLESAVTALRETNVIVGAQDLFWQDSGAFTGEVSGAELAEIGAGVVEVGHAERRGLFGETDEVVALKAAAALRNSLVPVLCVGEQQRSQPADAATECIRQLTSALHGAPSGRVVVAYEPVWAIGAESPAEPAYIREVCTLIRAAFDLIPDRPARSLIYGGSAGPGLLTELGDAVDGLFLGRFAHDPLALSRVIDEAEALAGRRAA